MEVKKNKKQKEEKQEITQKKGKKGKEVSTAPEKVSKDKYLYVYGITYNDFNLDLKGMKDKPIQKFDIKDIAVLFSFYPDLYPMLEEKEAMLHAEILNKIADRTTIIPMAFGTIFKDQEILETVLTKSYPVAKKTLELIKNKIELVIKVVKKESEEIPEEVSKEILGELNKLSVKSVQGDKFSDWLLLNHSFLVERNNFAQFSDKIGELEEKNQNLKFLYTGPWPAYSFIDINIKAG